MGSQVSQLAIPFIAAKILSAPVSRSRCWARSRCCRSCCSRCRRGRGWTACGGGRSWSPATWPGRRPDHDSGPYTLGALTIWQLYAVGFVAGFLTVLFDVADMSFLPVLLDADDLVEGNAKLQFPAATAQIVGPGLAGGIMGLVAAPFAIIVDASSFLVSGGLISLIRKHEPKPVRKIGADGLQTSLRQEIVEGLRYVIGNRYLRMIAGSTGMSNLGSSMGFAIFAVYAYVELGLTPQLVGLALGLGSIGVVIGAVTAAPLARRFGVGPVIVGSMFINGPAFFLMVFLPASALVAGAMLLTANFVMGFAAVVYNVNLVSFRQAITPSRRRAG